MHALDRKDFSALHRNLLRLCFIRLVALTALFASLGIASYFFSIKVLWHFFIPVVTVLLVINLFTLYRAKNHTPVTNQEFSTHLILDILLFSILIYLSGGITNPFASYFLVPVIISASTLPYLTTWLIAALTISAYSILSFHYIPIISMHHATMHTDFLNWHFIGMTANFILTIIIVMFFVIRMVQTINLQKFERNKFKEETMQDEQVLALAFLSAGFAHELRTPLSTLKILIDEIFKDSNTLPTTKSDLSIMKEQVKVCDDKIVQLLDYIKNAQNKQWIQLPPKKFIESSLDYWQLIRPQARFSIEYNNENNLPLNIALEHDYRLQQVVINLLNNAADSCSQAIKIKVFWSTIHFTLEIYDYGNGLPPEIISHLGEPFISTKKEGLGLGFYLSHSTINHYNGSLSFQNRKYGGTLTCMQIPLKR